EDGIRAFHVTGVQTCALPIYIESARVSVLDHGLTVGDGIFETVKAVDGRPFALTRHLDRLTRSARGLGLPDPDLDEVRRACAAEIGRASCRESEAPAGEVGAV